MSFAVSGVLWRMRSNSAGAALPSSGSGGCERTSFPFPVSGLPKVPSWESGLGAEYVKEVQAAREIASSPRWCPSFSSPSLHSRFLVVSTTPWVLHTCMKKADSFLELFEADLSVLSLLTDTDADPLIRTELWGIAPPH